MGKSMTFKIGIEDSILSGLILQTEFCKKVIPFLKEEYFTTSDRKKIFNIVNDYYVKYETAPAKQVVYVELEEGLGSVEYEKCIEVLEGAQVNAVSADWLYEKTEEFCKERALYNAIHKSILIIDGQEKDLRKDAIPTLIQDALAVCFDSSVGHDYFEDYQSRYEFYHTAVDKIPFSLEILNKITKGGLARKTLTAIASRTGGGKSMMGVHLAADFLKLGFNVLYITMEMAEERIAERIDANILNTKMDSLVDLSNESFSSRLAAIKSKTAGRLIIKEYPTGDAHAGHFQSLIGELKSKKDFVPDVLIVDYLGICDSQKVRNSSANSYTKLKSISEELRSLAVKHNLAAITFMQLQRGAINSTDVDEDATADSFGVVHTFDLYLALIRNPDLDEMGQVMCKILKTRYNDPNYYRRFILGVDMSKMKFYDPENIANEELIYNQMQTEKKVLEAKKRGKNAMDEVTSHFDFSDKETAPMYIEAKPKENTGFDAFDFD
jgi:replicative DNA helicase